MAAQACRSERISKAVPFQLSASAEPATVRRVSPLLARLRRVDGREEVRLPAKTGSGRLTSIFRCRLDLHTKTTGVKLRR